MSSNSCKSDEPHNCSKRFQSIARTSGRIALNITHPTISPPDLCSLKGCYCCSSIWIWNKQLPCDEYIQQAVINLPTQITFATLLINRSMSIAKNNKTGMKHTLLDQQMKRLYLWISVNNRPPSTQNVKSARHLSICKRLSIAQRSPLLNSSPSNRSL